MSRGGAGRHRSHREARSAELHIRARLWGGREGKHPHDCLQAICRGAIFLVSDVSDAGWVARLPALFVWGVRLMEKEAPWI